MKTLYTIVGLSFVVLTAGYIYLRSDLESQNVVPDIMNFEDCVMAGNIVMESYPRQCRTQDGRTFAEEIKKNITYVNSSSNDIQVDLPFPGAVTGKNFSIIGKARGTWYFEASFPVEVLDKDGKILFVAPAQAQSDWMTENFVNFKIDIVIPEQYIGPGTIVLKKDNPSGDSSKDASISIPITIEY
ncbi:MAG: Gmad2 immunoglobulin-like domain-containing protein [Minisyncoccia bacterium]